jgi:hypothetical protein
MTGGIQQTGYFLGRMNSCGSLRSKLHEPLARPDYGDLVLPGDLLGEGRGKRGVGRGHFLEPGSIHAEKGGFWGEESIQSAQAEKGAIFKVFNLDPGNPGMACQGGKRFPF